MTQYLPIKFKEKAIKKLDKIELFKRILDPEDIKKIIPKFVEFNEDEKNSEALFNDGTRFWIIIQTPEENDFFKPRKTNSKFHDNNYLLLCKFKLGQVSLFATKKQLDMIEWDSTILITGKLTRQYRIKGEQKYYKNLGEIARNLKIKIEAIDKKDYDISYTVNLFQIIDYLLRGHKKIFTEIIQKKLNFEFDDTEDEDPYSKMTDKEINKIYEEFNEEEFLKDINDYFSNDEQIDLVQKGIKLTIAKEYNIDTGKNPIWHGNITNPFKKWLKIKYPEEFELFEEYDDIKESIEENIKNNKKDETERKYLTPKDIRRKIRENQQKIIN